MVAGHLQEKKGYFYMVLSYPDAAGKRKTKWFPTGLPVKGNKKKAEKMLMETRQTFVPECTHTGRYAVFGLSASMVGNRKADYRTYHIRIILRYGKERYHSVFQGKRNHTFRTEGNRHSGFLYEAVETSKS